MFCAKLSGGKFAIIIAVVFALASTAHVKAAPPANCAANPKATSAAVKKDGKHFTVVVEGTGPDVVYVVVQYVVPLARHLVYAVHIDRTEQVLLVDRQVVGFAVDLRKRASEWR